MTSMSRKATGDLSGAEAWRSGEGSGGGGSRGRRRSGDGGRRGRGGREWLAATGRQPRRKKVVGGGWGGSCSGSGGGYPCKRRRLFGAGCRFCGRVGKTTTMMMTRGNRASCSRSGGGRSVVLLQA